MAQKKSNYMQGLKSAILARDGRALLVGPQESESLTGFQKLFLKIEFLKKMGSL